MSKVLFVIVIYRIKQEESLAWQQLHTLLGETDDIYVHDNTDDNKYLAAAYNEAWHFAQQHGYTWMSILDADTAVTSEYIAAVQEAAKNNGTAAYCPTLLDERNRIISPLRAYGMKVAFNSGLLIPIELIERIGGFNENYPLDYLDYWFCLQLHRLQIPLITMSVALHHSLSVRDYTTVPQWRYLSLLAAEKRFAKEIGRETQYKMHLFCRLVKWTVSGHKYVRETYNALLAKK